MSKIKRISSSSTTSSEPRCGIHSLEALSRFCKSCDSLACMDCILGLHKSHDWCKVNDIVAAKKQELFNNLRLVQSGSISHLTARISETNRALNGVSGQIEKIDKQGEKIIDYVKDVQKQLKEDCREKAKHSKYTIGKAENYKQRLEDVKNACSEKYKTGCDADIILANQSLKYAMADVKTENYSNQLLPWSFEQGIIDKGLILSMFGRFTSSRSQYEVNERSKTIVIPKKSETTTSTHRRDVKLDINISFNVLSTFKHGTFDIYSICPIAKKSWIHQREIRTNTIVDIDGGVIKKIDFQFEVNSFAKSRKNGILFCSDFRNNCVYKVTTSNGVVTKLFETQGLRPTSVSVTMDGHLLVSLVDKFEFVISRQSQRKISKMKMNGIEVDVYGSNGMFTAPCKAVQNGNWDICVVDVLGDRKGRLCVLDTDGRLKYVYREYNRGASLSDRWITDISAWDVCCDSRNRMIVSCSKNNEIRFIDSFGKLLEIFITTGYGIDTKPLCIGVDDFIVWIGFEGGRVMVLKYDAFD